jgi:hypothetical protein
MNAITPTAIPSTPRIATAHQLRDSAVLNASDRLDAEPDVCGHSPARVVDMIASFSNLSFALGARIDLVTHADCTVHYHCRRVERIDSYQLSQSFGTRIVFTRIAARRIAGRFHDARQASIAIDRYTGFGCSPRSCGSEGCPLLTQSGHSAPSTGIHRMFFPSARFF